MSASLVAVQTKIDLDCIQVKANQVGLRHFRYVVSEWIAMHDSSYQHKE